MSASSTSARQVIVPRIEITGPIGVCQHFRVDLIRADTGKRVCQCLRTDYGEAILAAGRLEWADLPVVDLVGFS